MAFGQIIQANTRIKIRKCFPKEYVEYESRYVIINSLHIFEKILLYKTVIFIHYQRDFLNNITNSAECTQKTARWMECAIFLASFQCLRKLHQKITDCARRHAYRK